MDDQVIRIADLTKTYPGGGRGPASETARPAVDAIDLDVHRGKIFGLLGPNGPARPPPSAC